MLTTFTKKNRERIIPKDTPSSKTSPTPEKKTIGYKNNKTNEKYQCLLDSRLNEKLNTKNNRHEPSNRRIDEHYHRDSLSHTHI